MRRMGERAALVDTALLAYGAVLILAGALWPYMPIADAQVRAWPWWVRGLVVAAGLALLATWVIRSWRAPVLEPDGDQGVPKATPPIPTHLVVRTDKLREITERVRPGGRPVALVGMGGAGKSTLAAGLWWPQRRTPAEVWRVWRLRRRFRDGMAWLDADLYQEPVALLADLARRLDASETESTTSRAGREELETALVGRRVLVVVDNVRELAQVHALGGLGRQYGLVFTTWDEDIAPAMRADPVEVGALTEKQALELLGLWCDRRASRLPAAARQVCAQVQNLALGVVTAGAMVARGHSLTDVPALLEQGADRVRGDLDPEYPYRGLPAAIEAALTTLPEEDQDRYARLAVFAGRGPFPRAAAERLWGPELSPAQVADLLADLVNRALLTPAGPDRYTAHDPHYDVMFSRLGGEDGTDLAAAHAHLIERYRRPGTWAHAAADPYLGPRLIGHLSAAGYAEELRTVLADVAWIRARLAHGGLSGLLADYDYADDALGLQIARALRMSADAVTADPELVAVQLAARLLSHPDPEVAEWARALDRPDRRLWPAGPYPALTPATEPLVETQFGYDNEMFKVAISADGATVVGADFEGSLQVWNLRDGGEPRVLTGPGDSVEAVAVTADGAVAVSGYEDGSVLVWNLRDGGEPYALTEHTDAVEAVAISADGSTAISGDVAGSIRVWDLTGDGEPRVLTGHTAQVAAVAISADGTIAAGGDIEGSVRVWDLATAECIASWIGDHPIKGCTVISGELPRIGVGQNRGAPYLLELRRTA